MAGSEDYFYTDLRRRIQAMAASPEPRQTKLYKVLVAELKPLGYWKAKPRGKAFPAGAENPRNKTKS